MNQHLVSFILIISCFSTSGQSLPYRRLKRQINKLNGSGQSKQGRSSALLITPPVKTALVGLTRRMSIQLSFSGGGVRSSTATGVVLRLMDDHGLLDDVYHVRAVSGGYWGVNRFCNAKENKQFLNGFPGLYEKYRLPFYEGDESYYEKMKEVFDLMSISTYDIAAMSDEFYFLDSLKKYTGGYNDCLNQVGYINVVKSTLNLDSSEFVLTGHTTDDRDSKIFGKKGESKHCNDQDCGMYLVGSALRWFNGEFVKVIMKSISKKSYINAIGYAAGSASMISSSSTLALTGAITTLTTAKGSDWISSTFDGYADMGRKLNLIPTSANGCGFDFGSGNSGQAWLSQWNSFTHKMKSLYASPQQSVITIASHETDVTTIRILSSGHKSILFHSGSLMDSWLTPELSKPDIFVGDFERKITDWVVESIELCFKLLRS